MKETTDAAQTGQTSRPAYARARFQDVIKYSFGGLGSNLGWNLTQNYLTYFYTDIFGLGQYVVAALMLASRLIDAITDPLMGMISDHTRSKWGRYRPWLRFGAPILGIAIFLLFTATSLSPEGNWSTAPLRSSPLGCLSWAILPLWFPCISMRLRMSAMRRSAASWISVIRPITNNHRKEDCLWIIFRHEPPNCCGR